MTLPVIIGPEAELDLAAAQLWYEAERPGLGAEFPASVGQAIGLIGSHPHMFPVVLHGARRALLCWFPSSGLGTQGVKLSLHASFTRLAGKLELPDGVPKPELGNQQSKTS